MTLDSIQQLALELSREPASPGHVRWFNVSLRDMAGKLSKAQRLALCSAIFGTPVVSTKYLTTGQLSAYAMVAVQNPDEMKLLIKLELAKERVL